MSSPSFSGGPGGSGIGVPPGGTARAFASTSVPLLELKALAHAHQATLNDMVLMLCSGALRSYLKQHGTLPRKSLVAAVPISLAAANSVAVLAWMTAM